MEKKPYYITTAIAYQENLILETHMKLFLQTALQDLKDRKDMMYVSRQERMSMDRRSN